MKELATGQCCGRYQRSRRQRAPTRQAGAGGPGRPPRLQPGPPPAAPRSRPASPSPGGAATSRIRPAPLHTVRRQRSAGRRPSAVTASSSTASGAQPGAGELEHQGAAQRHRRRIGAQAPDAVSRWRQAARAARQGRATSAGAPRRTAATSAPRRAAAGRSPARCHGRPGRRGRACRQPAPRRPRQRSAQVGVNECARGLTFGHGAASILAGVTLARAAAASRQRAAGSGRSPSSRSAHARARRSAPLARSTR